MCSFLKFSRVLIIISESNNQFNPQTDLPPLGELQLGPSDEHWEKSIKWAIPQTRTKGLLCESEIQRLLKREVSSVFLLVLTVSSQLRESVIIPQTSLRELHMGRSDGSSSSWMSNQDWQNVSLIRFYLLLSRADTKRPLFALSMKLFVTKKL